MFKLFKNLTKKDIFFMCVIFIFTVIQVLLELRLPVYMSEMTVLFQMKSIALNGILSTLLKMLLCSFLSLIVSCMIVYLVSSVASNFTYNVRKKIFEKVESFSLGEIKKFKTSSLITRTTNDVTHVEMLLVRGFSLLIKAPLMAIFAISKIINKNIQFSILTAVGTIILLIVVFILTIIVMPKFEKERKLVDKVNGVTRENITGIRVLRAFNASGFQGKRFNKVNNDLTNMQLFIDKSFAILNPFINLIMHYLTLGIYFIGAILMLSMGTVDKVNLFGDMMIFTSYGTQIIASFLMLAMIFMMLPRSKVAASRIVEVLNEEVSIHEGDDSKLTDIKGSIEFKNVSFKFPDAKEYILKDISFKVSKGQTLAIIGSTGSGKTTLVNLITRFYDVTKGSVFVDGINVKDYKEETLNNKIGYVSQNPVIFSKSISDNVSYGNKKIKKEEILHALDIAQASDFVSKMDKKENSMLSRGGSNISGGQKQRISISRAIAKNPEIYIFDDSFSALDYNTDYNLRKALKDNIKDATSIIVAQRIGTIIHADKIIVLEDGCIVGCGSHDELLKTCSVYKEIAVSQLGEEVL